MIKGEHLLFNVHFKKRENSKRVFKLKFQVKCIELINLRGNYFVRFRARTKTKKRGQKKTPVSIPAVPVI